MTRGLIDTDGLDRDDIKALRNARPPADMPFAIGKLSHVVLKVAYLERAVEFYTQVLGFRISDVYPESMMPGRMVFLRFNPDHHGIALVSGAGGPATGAELHHVAYEVSTLDEVFRARDHLEKHGVVMIFEGRRRAGQQIAVEFKDPDGHVLEICWGIDRINANEPSRPAEEWRAAASLEDAVRNAPSGQDVTLADLSLMRD
ncbi:MAG: catechol 2,3-dioxygenase [Alphaproteobacteria bacterium]|jgi:catechol 2,3-dioxygenase-like lactoylglutathione lyase family enzyme